MFTLELARDATCNCYCNVTTQFKSMLRSFWMRTQYVICTWNNPTKTLDEYFEELFDTGKLTFIAGQLERGEQGTDHFQFYVECSSRLRLGQWKQLLGPAVHIEARKGSAQQAYTYCTKEETRQAGPVELGSISQQYAGRRTDLEELKKSLDDGANMQTISQEHFGQFLRYRKSIEYYMLLNLGTRDWQMDVRIYWGDTNTGKTKKCFGDAKENGESVYVLTQNDSGTPWFDGYAGQDVILIDDFYGWIKVSFLLKLMDRYPMNVQVKGSMVPFVSKKIVFTSNKDPRDWYSWPNEQVKKAFFRRVTETRHFQTPFQ